MHDVLMAWLDLSLLIILGLLCPPRVSRAFAARLQAALVHFVRGGR